MATPRLDKTLRANPTSNDWVSGVVRAARESNVDPAQAIAIALEESGGDPRATGDNNSSYGLFQLHKGGALGNLTPQQAYDPYTNAGTVLRAWGKLGGGAGLDPRAALMQYYSRVGRGASNEVPTTRALGLLGRAKQLYAQSGAPSAAASAPSTPPSAPSSAQQLQSVDPTEAMANMEFSTLLRGGGHTKPIDLLAGAIMGDQQATQMNAALANLQPQGTAATTQQVAAKGGAQRAAGTTAAGGQAPFTLTDGGDPTKRVSMAVHKPLGTYQAVVGRPFQGTHTDFHNWESDNATDLQAPAGTPVYAVAPGVIGSQIGPLNSSNPHLLGDRVHLQTADNEFYYAHLKSYVVKPGQRVQAGQLLGYTGALNHLHFGAKYGDPMQILGIR